MCSKGEEIQFVIKFLAQSMMGESSIPNIRSVFLTSMIFEAIDIGFGGNDGFGGGMGFSTTISSICGCSASSNINAIN